MGLTREQFEIFKRHLEKHKLPPCPICQSNEWGIAGTVALAGAHPFGSQNVVVGDGTIATIVVICKTCDYVHQFAWFPMALRAERERLAQHQGTSNG